MDFFPKKLQKIARLLGLCPQKPVASGWGLHPHTPVCYTFELHYFIQRVSQFRHFHFLTIGLILSLERDPSHVRTPCNGF